MIQVELHRADRDELLSLFELADDSRIQIATYIALGDVLVARDGSGIVGHLQIVETDAADVFELKSMAVIEPRRGEGVGGSLVDAAIASCVSRGGLRLIVSTASADIGNLRFYQRRGFRMYRIVQDAFGPSTGYPEDVLIDGIPLRDQVFLELPLRP